MFEEGHRRTQRMIDVGRKEFRELINKIDERMAKTDGWFAKMDERFDSLLRAIEMHIKVSTTQTNP